MRWWADRLYKSGTGWCVWRWTDVPTGYIVRLHVLKTNLKRGLGALCVHWINGPDPDPVHDHPVRFISIIVKGWYDEVRYYPDGHMRLVRRRWFNIIGLKDRHRILRVSPGGCITFCIMGPKPKGWNWGFYIQEEWVGERKISWQEYNAAKKRAQTEGLIQCRKQEVSISPDPLPG